MLRRVLAGIGVGTALTLAGAGLIVATPPSHADSCVDNTVKPGTTNGADYFVCRANDWQHVEPMFDPNSADGYGPNQPLPPKCVRFPSDYTCPTDGPPPDFGDTGY